MTILDNNIPNEIEIVNKVLKPLQEIATDQIRW